MAQNPKPRFDFLKTTSNRFKFCGGLVRGYASVIRPYLESLMRDGGGIMPLVLPSSEFWTKDDDTVFSFSSTVFNWRSWRLGIRWL